MDTRTQNTADEWLVLRSQDGDEKALDMLVRRWQKQLWSYARRLVRTDAAAWDVLQDAWMGIIRSLHRLQDPASFRSWAYRIVTNKCADFIRKNTRQERIAERQAEEISQTGSTDEDPDVEFLREAISLLGVEHRAVLSMHYIEGMDIKTIGEILGIPSGTVKSRLHNARETLRQKLERRER